MTVPASREKRHCQVRRIQIFMMSREVLPVGWTMRITPLKEAREMNIREELRRRWNLA